MFFTGYLKKISEYQLNRCIYLELAIPNEEVAYIYENTIRDWFREHLEQTDLTPLYKAVLEADCETFAIQVSEQLMAGGGVALIGITLVPLLSGLFG